MDLSRLLAPRSVAVLGATDRPASYGAQALLNLEAIGFPGPVIGVNPKRAEVLGRPCVPTLADLPEPVDAVVMAIPAAGVPAAVEQAGAVGCGGAVVIGAGFAEVPEGVSLQRELVNAAHRHELPVCGPNCNGIVAMHARAVLWGDALTPHEPGPVALVSQSGNVAVNALATRRGVRFHTVVASGNQAVLGAADYLAFLAGEADVGAIALYLEDDGGPRLCDGLAACAAAGVPVVVLKVGSSAAGARAAAAHSAALAGDQRIFRALIEEAGGVWAADVHELLELAKALAVRPARRCAALSPAPTRATATPAGGLAIMTCSGGDSAQGADEAARLGLELPALAPATCQRLREVLPTAATVANPLDYTALLWGDGPTLTRLVQTVGEDPAIDQVLVFYDQFPGLAGDMAEASDAVRNGVIAGARAIAESAATMICSTLPELLDDAAAWRCVQAGIPAIAGLRTGLACAAAMRTPPGDPARLREIGAAARQRSGTSGEWLSEDRAKELLRAGGVEVVDGRLVTDAADAVRALDELGAPIALKLSSPAIQHKSELGAVWLGLSSEAEVADAFARLEVLMAQFGGAVLAERMALPGVELIVAARADAVVPAVIVGLGGVWTEVLDNVAIVPLPADAARIERAVRGLRGAPLLTGGRGSTPVDLSAVARMAQRVGELLLEESLELLELNPVLAGPGGAMAVDAAARQRVAVPEGVEAAAVEAAA
ncbi:MAG: acetate--CoA ligase family protein [Solirubrobacterales bacterium]|nr:acetate--CoA ligase family protein [Solirubrobacterales bacterium]